MRRTLGPPLMLIFGTIMSCLADELSENQVTLAPSLPICEEFQACSAQISIFPDIPPTETESSTTQPILSTSGIEYAEFIGGEELTFIQASPKLDIFEGSGESDGSGFFEFEPFPDPNFHYNLNIDPESTVFPYYDEFVSTPNLFDFNSQPNTTQKRLCRCPDGNESTGLSSDFSNFLSDPYFQTIVVHFQMKQV